MILNFNVIETLVMACAILWVGMELHKKISILNKYNIPSPVIGGVVFAVVNLLLRGHVGFVFDMAMKDTLMIAFFTTIGLAASYRILAKGGKQVFFFLIVASVLIFLQNAVAVGISYLTGLNPMLGLLAGSITMSGGHGTGASFAQYFTERFGLQGTTELALAAATFGLVAGSVLGGPVARKLIEGKNLRPKEGEDLDMELAPVVENLSEEMHGPSKTKDFIMSIMQISICVALGSVAYGWLKSRGIQVPTYLCALFVGIIIRNAAELTNIYKVNIDMIEQLGGTCLYLFLAMALMSLELWQLAEIAGPMVAILAGEMCLMALFAYFITFNFSGRDYNAAVLAGGHCGFGLGATPNAIANMQALTLRYGPAPRAFFTVSIVGAFFIDIVNAFVIQLFVSFIL